MKNLSIWVAKARQSPFYRWLLSFALGRIVPFNKAHHFRITQVLEQGVELRLPYRKSNCNHLGGLHACALATLAELTTGVSLLAFLGTSEYRLILARLEMDYHYQARQAVRALFELDPSWLEEEIRAPLKAASKVTVPCTIELYDEGNHHIATGTVHWQLKSWHEVKTGR